MVSSPEISPTGRGIHSGPRRARTPEQSQSAPSRGKMGPGEAPPAPRARTSLQRLQKLHQIALLRLAQVQPEVPVVVIDDVAQGGEAAVVVVAPLAVRPEPLERRGAVVAVRRAVGLEGVDADLLGRVAGPGPLGVEGGRV